MAEARTEEHIRGWLLFLCIWLIAVKGLALLGAVAGEIGASNSRETLIMLLFALYFAFGLSAGIVLWSRARGAVTYARVYFLLQPVLMFLLWRLYAPGSASVGAGSDVAGPSPVAIASAFIGSVLWFSYLTCSKRVKRTFESARNGRKSLVLAFFLGAFLGPGGALYFGVLAFAVVLVSSLLSVVILALLAFGLPSWMQFIWLPFNAIACLFMAAAYNEGKAAGDDAVEEVVASGAILYSEWLLRLGFIVAGINNAIRFAQRGKWGVAILAVVVGIPLSIWLAQGVVAIVQLVVVAMGTAIGALGQRWRRRPALGSSPPSSGDVAVDPPSDTERKEGTVE